MTTTVAPVIGVEAWTSRALCRVAGRGLFYPPIAETADARREREASAKRLCGNCPVRAACDAFAVRTQQRLGIWGGLTEGERRRREVAPAPR